LCSQVLRKQGFLTFTGGVPSHVEVHPWGLDKAWPVQGVQDSYVVGDVAVGSWDDGRTPCFFSGQSRPSRLQRDWGNVATGEEA
jgi:hypothetical protein